MDITKRAKRRMWLGIAGLLTIAAMSSYGVIKVCGYVGEENGYYCHTLFATGFFSAISMFIIMIIIAGYHNDEKDKLKKDENEQKEDDAEKVGEFMKKSIELTNVRQNMLTRGLEALKEADAQGINYPLMAWKEQYEAFLEDWKEVDLDRKDFLERCNRLYGTSFKIHESCDKSKEGK